MVSDCRRAFLVPSLEKIRERKKILRRARCRDDSMALKKLAVLRQSVQRVYGAHLRVIASGDAAPFKEMSQRWQVVSNTASDVTGPRFEPQTLNFKTRRGTKNLRL